jgi:Uma2 family endonuclease
MNAPIALMPEAAMAVSLDDRGYEVVNGKRVELPPMSAYEVHIASRLLRFLGNHADQANLGHTEGEMLFLLDAARELERRPDVAFVSFQHWPQDRLVPRTSAWDVVPDVIVEVVSATNYAVELLLKVKEYLQAGVREVWLVYPGIEQVYVYQSPAAIRVWTRSEELQNSVVFPQLRLPVALVFQGGAAANG